MQSGADVSRSTERSLKRNSVYLSSPPTKHHRMSHPNQTPSALPLCSEPPRSPSLPSKQPLPSASAQPSRERSCISADSSIPCSSPSPELSSPAFLPTTSTALVPNGTSDRKVPDSRWFRKPTVVWFRGHDLRVDDHPALLAAAQRGGPVVPLFVWDPTDSHAVSLGDAKKWWLRKSLLDLERNLRRLGVKLYFRLGLHVEQVRAFLKATDADTVFWNRCYEPHLVEQDEKLRSSLSGEGYIAESFKAELIVEPWELSASDVCPRFKTFNSYLRAWMKFPPPPEPSPSPTRLKSITKEILSADIESLELRAPLDVESSLAKYWTPGSEHAQVQLESFLREVFPRLAEKRHRYRLTGTSRLSPHIRFGEISARRMYHASRRHVCLWNQKIKLASNAARNSRRITSSVPNNSSSCPDNHLDGSHGHFESNNLSSNHLEPARTKKNNVASANNGLSQSQALGYDSDPAFCGRMMPPVMVSEPKEKSGGISFPPISISARIFLKNLCLREFAYHVLFHFSDLNTKPLVPEFTKFPWEKDDGSFERWREGKTGYPIVDAAMRQLKCSGWIHNQLRFLLASFLTKHLLLPWVKGLNEFYSLLVDGDHSSNGLGWQWTAGSNTDSFPLKILVNPVRVGYRHDPNGTYVRNWVPELARLPRKYVHEPWKAPPSVLKAAGVELGSSYPKRIIQMAQAKVRVQKTIAIMRQVFAMSGVCRSLPDLTEVEVKDVPDEQPDLPRLEDPSPITPKLNLLPSLWSLVRYDSTNSYLNDTSGSIEPPIIALDTASLDESALAVPMDEGESIEHSLLAAHEVGNTHRMGPCLSDERLAASMASLPDADLLTLGYPNYLRQSYDSEDNGENSIGSESMDAVDNLDVLSDTDRDTREGSIPITREPGSFHVAKQHGEVNDRNMPHSMFRPANDTVPPPTAELPQSFGLENSRPVPPKPPPNIPPNHLTSVPEYHSHSSRGLGGGYTTPDSFGGVRSTAAMVGPTASTGTHVVVGALPNGNDMSAASQDFGDPSAAMYAPHLGINPFYGFSPFMPMLNSAGTERSDMFGGHSSKFAPVSGMMPMGYNLYGGGVFNNGLINGGFGANGAPYATIPHNAVPPVPPPTGGIPLHTQLPVPSAPSVPTGHSSSQLPLHMSSPLASHHTNLSNIGYGMTQPYAMHTHGASRMQQGLSADQMVNGTHARETSLATGIGTHASNNSDVGDVPSSINKEPPERLNWPLEAPKTEPVHEAIYKGTPRKHTLDLVQAEHKNTMDDNRTGSMSPSMIRNLQPLQKEKHTAEVPADTSRNPGKRSLTNGDVRPTGSRVRKNGRSNMCVPKSNGIVENGRISRTNGKRSRTNVEDRVTNISRGKLKNKSDKPGSVQDEKDCKDSGAAPISLQEREGRLTSILAEPDHEYHEFAKYIDENYELTDNTDRHSSKDYLRLCNLKDDYHKQCKLDQAKLKIYRIKAFFSKILQLEVTGEWDRHNHGGVRGPYVYGIRLRKKDKHNVGAGEGRGKDDG